MAVATDFHRDFLIPESDVRSRQRAGRDTDVYSFVKYIIIESFLLFNSESKKSATDLLGLSHFYRIAARRQNLSINYGKAS